MRRSRIFINTVFATGIVYALFHYLYLKEALQKERKQTMKLEQLLRMANQMIVESDKGNLIHKMLEERNLSSVAIYGMSEMGERVMENILMHSSIKLLYGIDQRAEEIKLVIPVYTLEEAAEKDKPEAVILTAFSENDSLKKEIENIMSCEVVTLGELFYEQ